jgi:hypothetical protein
VTLEKITSKDKSKDSFVQMLGQKHGKLEIGALAAKQNVKIHFSYVQENFESPDGVEIKINQSLFPLIKQKRNLLSGEGGVFNTQNINYPWEIHLHNDHSDKLEIIRSSHEVEITKDERTHRIMIKNPSSFIFDKDFSFLVATPKMDSAARLSLFRADEEYMAVVSFFPWMNQDSFCKYNKETTLGKGKISYVKK